MTGLLPSPGEESTAPSCQSLPPAASPSASDPEADQIITRSCAHELLAHTQRPAALSSGRSETYERLRSVAGVSLDVLATHYEPRLAQLYQGLQTALAPFAETYQDIHQGAAWLRDIAYILEPVPTHPLRAADIAGQLRSYLDTVQRNSRRSRL